MIAFLQGKPVIIDDSLIIMVTGVGYGVSVGQTLLRKLSLEASNESAQETQLFIYTHVKEEALELFGFETFHEKKLFALLLSVSGIGPRTALNIVDHGSEALSTAVQEAQVHFFTAIPRVGKKLAQKIIIELRGKLGEIKSLNLGGKPSAYQDVVDSLMGLGFAEEAIIKILDTIDLATVGEEAAVKHIIKQLGKKQT